MPSDFQQKTSSTHNLSTADINSTTPISNNTTKAKATNIPLLKLKNPYRRKKNRGIKHPAVFAKPLRDFIEARKLTGSEDTGSS